MKKTILLLSLSLFADIVYAAAPALEPNTVADCQPRINPTRFIPYSDEHELICLKKGLKNIFWGHNLSFEGDLNEKEWNNSTFSTLKYNIFGFYREVAESSPRGAIIYRKTLERNALLLEKYFLENGMSLYSDYINIMTSVKSPEKRIEEIQKLNDKENAYIIGALLEYDEEKAEYYYQYHAFMDAHPADDTEPQTDLEVQEEAKKVRSWALANQGKWKTSFDNDKNAYKEWMALNKGVPNATLRKQNEALSKAIGTLNYNSML